MGTGAHMEGFGIESLTDMRTKVMAALNAGGWTENAETGRFAEKSTHGREVFALFRNNALCVTTIVVGMVDGAEPGPEAKKDGKVRLSALNPISGNGGYPSTVLASRRRRSRPPRWPKSPPMPQGPWAK